MLDLIEIKESFPMADEKSIGQMLEVVRVWSERFIKEARPHENTFRKAEAFAGCLIRLRLISAGGLPNDRELNKQISDLMDSMKEYDSLLTELSRSLISVASLRGENRLPSSRQHRQLRLGMKGRLGHV